MLCNLSLFIIVEDLLYIIEDLLYMLRGVTNKKRDCFNHAFGTMPIGKPLGHCKIQLLSYVVFQIFCSRLFHFCVTSFYVT